MKSLGETIKKIFPNLENVSYEDLKQRQIERFNESEGDLNEVDGYDCRKCKNKGFIAHLSNEGEEVWRDCKCKTVRATLRRAKRSGLGDILKDYSFDKFVATETWQRELKEKAQAFCKDDTAHWFYIGGQVGCGKTHLCTAIAAHYIKAGKELRYMLWAEESKFLKANVNENVYTEKMNEYKNVDVLYIDDFLKVKSGAVPTDADINLAFEIINHRLITPDKITILSSEKTLDELMDYDEAMMSRIYKQTGPYKFSIAKDRNKNYRLRE